MNQTIPTGTSTFSLEPGESATFYASSDAAGKVTPDFGGAVLTITGGSATKVGPYSQRMGMSVRLDSGSISAIRDGGCGELTADDTAKLKALAAGDITHASALAGSVAAAHQDVRTLIDGPAAGQRLRWWKPSANAGFWGYDISPSDRYTG